MSEPVRPALSAVEWAAFDKYGGLDACEARSGPNAYFDADAVAALALHGQSFGFTHEDVSALASCENYSITFEGGERFDGVLLVGVTKEELLSIAHRINALLPPRTPDEP